MPYRVRKSKCRRSDGKRGSWVLAYKDKSGKSHSNCHTSKSGAEAQIAAIEGPKESLEYAGEKTMKLTSTQLRRIIAEEVEAAMTQAPRKKPAAAAAPKAAPKKRVPTAAVIAGSIADLVGDGVPGDYMEAAEVLLSHMSEPRPDRDAAVEDVADVLGNAIMDSMMDAGDDDDDMGMEMDFDAFGVASAVVDMYM